MSPAPPPADPLPIPRGLGSGPELKPPAPHRALQYNQTTGNTSVRTEWGGHLTTRCRFFGTKQRSFRTTLWAAG